MNRVIWTLTPKQARRVLAALAGPSVTDEDIACLYNDLAQKLGAFDTPESQLSRAMIKEHTRKQQDG